MAQRHTVRRGDQLLIAAFILALAAQVGEGARAETLPLAGGPALAAISLGQVGTVGTEPGGLAQFTLDGPIGPGVLNLGLRPVPGSILVIEGNQALAPMGRDVKGDLLSISVRLQGTGGLWVVTGPTAGPAIQVLAVLDVAPAGVSASPGFPSDRVLDELSRLAGSRSASWFSPTRLGPWLVPRRKSDVPSLPGCAEHETGAGLRTCARESLSAIWNCLAHHDMSTRAIPGALALYLDDRTAYLAAEAAGAGGDCGRVAAMKPDDASREQARAVIAAACSPPGSHDEGEPGEVAAAPSEPAPGESTPRGSNPGGSTRGGSTPIEAAPAAPSPPEANAWEDDTVQEWEREDDISGLIAALQESCAGRSLLEALDSSKGTGLNTKVSLLAHEVAKSVEGWTGKVPDETDGDLRDAVDTLERLPRGSGCEPVVAIMALIDEWSARAAEGIATNGAAERFIDAFRDARKEHGDDLTRWLPDRFPILYRDADRILRYLE
jgi:hypothetical protein